MDNEEVTPLPLPRRLRWKHDLYAVGAFLLALAPMYAYWIVNADWLAQYDILTFFLPWYSHLGDRLRQFDIPAWMPWLSSGSPFAGDPSGGWWYWPAMLSFTLFSTTTVFKVMILIQTLIGAMAIYVFSRLIGMRPVAALVSTAAYVFGPFLAGQMGYGTVAGQASTWLPVSLLAIECSLRTPSLLGRFAWWGLAGVGVSQIAVSWPGQGLYNSLLIITAWIGYRSVIWPVRP